MTDNSIPTLYEWAGGAPALDRLTEVFYGHVLEDPLLRPLFEHMAPEHTKFIALWLGEVLGGPKSYTEQHGGHPHMISKHINLKIKPEQRLRWVQLISAAADEAGLPDDPEFRSAFMAYIEWGTRIGLSVSNAGDFTPDPNSTVPLWDWGVMKPILPAK